MGVFLTASPASPKGYAPKALANDQGGKDRAARIKQTVRKLVLSGFLRGVGDVKIATCRVGAAPPVYSPHLGQPNRYGTYSAAF